MSADSLIARVAWAIVELDGPRPNLPEIKRALEDAIVEAAKVTTQCDTRADCLARIAKVMGA